MKAVKRGQALLDELKKDYPELKLSPVFSRFGPRAGQCDLTTDLRKMVLEFTDLLAGEDGIGHERTQEGAKKLREVLIGIKSGDPLEGEADELEHRLLDPELKLYCGDVLIEYRCGVLNYESLRRLQQDSRFPSELNEVGTIRGVVGCLVSLAGNV